MSLALAYLQKALKMAQENQYEDLAVRAQYLLGFTYFNRWTNKQKREHDGDLQEAIAHFVAAQNILHHAQQQNLSIHPCLQGAILADGGRAHSYMGQDQRDRLNALHAIDQAGKIVSASGFQQSAHFLHIDVEWYHIDKVEALLASGCPGLALEELESVYQKGDLRARQRYLYTNILQAEAHIQKGWADVGVTYLEDALQSLSEVSSRRHLLHILRIHEGLQQDPSSRGSPEVARLGGHLLKVQHPELFQ